MASAGDQRGRDDVDDKPNKTGFDAPEDGPSIPGGIRPYEIVNESRERLLFRLARACLDIFNSLNGVESEPRKIVKVNVQCVPGAPRVAGLMYYITFIGHIRLCGSATFRGKILKMVDGFLDVKFCDMVLEEESGTSQEAGTSQV
ncbi:uncharacterized protein [Arachis hypogaea]|uniref:uncharacterized protein isoform X2 n=1 Tax=Arachis hypogaea TaxID=3818 RepID=UPI003B2218D9